MFIVVKWNWIFLRWHVIWICEFWIIFSWWLKAWTWLVLFVVGITGVWRASKMILFDSTTIFEIWWPISIIYTAYASTLSLALIWLRKLIIIMTIVKLVHEFILIFRRICIIFIMPTFVRSSIWRLVNTYWFNILTHSWGTGRFSDLKFFDYVMADQ